ncbi:fumarylacetoacetate hydrolase family protein [Coralliovum pocilloporae]|uniref:fumarylacetoacetate hydrolase family protein n=1 Tax=Coralliovum pocilloporae TaxID=3066369 RepID=UPI0033074133
MTFALECPDRPTIPIAGSDDLFPVNRIFCVGRNYAAHAREMGHDPDREPPFFFLKPADTLLSGSSCMMAYPPRTADLHHEVELVVALQSGGRDIPVVDALSHVFGAAVGLDLTRRDLQGIAKKAGRPWDLGKGFDGSALSGPIQRVSDGVSLTSGTISLLVNGTARQKGDLAMMIWSVAETIAELSTYLTLKPGDLLYTGTPEGVAALAEGDRLEARIDGLPGLDVVISGSV